MGLSSTGLTVETYEEVLDDIITSEQENVSSQIEVGDDTALGETNKIMASQISSVNQLLQDIYDQRDIYEAEGTALDDNISWLGLTRQSATATSGESYFLGNDGTTISSGSYVKSDSTGDTFTTDSAISISKSSCRGATIEVSTVASNGSDYDYTVTVGGVQSSYTYIDDDEEAEIIAGLQADLTTNANGNYTATIDSNDDTLLLIEVSDESDTSINIDSYLGYNSVTSAGDITNTETGALSATANSVTTILSPTSGWNSTYNPSQLIIGRDEETDSELRDRAINYRSSSGKATVDAIKAELLNVDGVSSVAINEQYVSDGVGTGTITIDSSSDSTAYPVEINGEIYSYTSGTGETTAEIATALATTIDPNGDGAGSNQIKAEDNGDGTITISSSTLYRADMEVDSDDDALLNAVEGQPGGSMQVVISGGEDEDIGKAMWDTKPGGVEFWALDGDTYDSYEYTDEYGGSHLMAFNRPNQVDFNVDITYKIFDSSVYPDNDEDAYEAVRDAVADFGNELGAGTTVITGEFEGTIYGAVSGIYDVYIEMTAVVSSITEEAASDDRNGITQTDIDLNSDDEAYFRNTSAYIEVIGTEV